MDAAADFAERLRVCLTAEDPDGALIAFSAELEVPGRLPRIPRTNWYENDAPQPIVGLGIALMANALIRGREARQARLYLETVAELITPSRDPLHEPGTSFRNLTGRFPYLWAPSQSETAIAAFQYDVADDPTAFDLERAVRIVAAHAPRKIRRSWDQGPGRRVLAFKPWAGDGGHGDAVNFTWRLLKAGYGPDLLRHASRLPQAQADKIFAMLAVFDRAECRSAAAEHFEMPDLPAMMALAFSERPSLKVHLAMADFGHVNPRWRAGLVSAMDAYALHRCTDEFLATMIENENEWLPNHVGAGAYDAYGNAQPYYYRAAVFNRMLHAPERLDFWLRTDWVLSYCDTARDRETRRFAEQWSRSPGQSARPSRASGTHCGSR